MVKKWHLPVLLAFVFLTCFNNAVQWYTHAQTYPISALVGANEYVAYSQNYEARLIFALYIPYSLLLGANLLLAVRPIAGIPRSAFVVTLALNLSIMAVSVLLAVPLHQAHMAQGYVTVAQVDELLQVNTIRLGAAFASSGIVLWMLTRLLSNHTSPQPSTARMTNP